MRVQQSSIPDRRTNTLDTIVECHGPWLAAVRAGLLTELCLKCLSGLFAATVGYKYAYQWEVKQTQMPLHKKTNQQKINRKKEKIFSQKRAHQHTKGRRS